MRRLNALITYFKTHAGALPSAKQTMLLALFSSLCAGSLLAYHKQEQLIAQQNKEIEILRKLLSRQRSNIEEESNIL